MQPLLERSRRGVLFPRETSRQVAPLMEEMMNAQGVRRIELFMLIFGLLSRAPGAVRCWPAPTICPTRRAICRPASTRRSPSSAHNLTQPFSEADLAAIAGQSTSAFSRAFRRHTGMSLVQYVKRLRINLACQILMSDEQAPITDICFEVGFNNLSNFNRQFLAEKGMTPSRFRRLLATISRPPKAA